MKTPLRSFLFSICILLSSFSFGATNYIFHGSVNTDWTDAANWANGLRPPLGLTTGDSVIVYGTAVIPNCISCPNATSSMGGGAVIYIAVNGSLTLRNQAHFMLGSNGIIYVSGTLVNETSFEVYYGGNIMVDGTLINKRWIGNQGYIQVNKGGVISNESNGTLLSWGNPPPGLDPLGITRISAGGTFNNYGTFELVTGGKLINEGAFNNYGTAKLQNGSVNGSGEVNSFTVLTGNATIEGDLTNAGTLAPGNSPGLYTVSADYTATSTAVHNFEVGGVTTSDYDRLNAGGNVYLNGTLNITLINGFTPSSGNADVPIITGTINGTFSTVNLPSQYHLVYNTNSVVLRVATALPVTFSSVDVKKEGSGARLLWQMQSETNVSRYEVERSENGREFKKVGAVNPVTSGGYSFFDPSPSSGVTYYRIRNVDRDGKFSYSIVVIYKQGRSTVPLTVFPSPAKGTIQVQHSAASSSHKITLTTVDGRILQTIFPAKGSQKTTLDISEVRAGVYIIQLYKGAEGSMESARFVKE